jgi:hypothetical protein
MDLTNLVRSVTKPWSKQRKAEERRESARANRYERLTRCRRTTIREAAWYVMERAYMKASSNGKLFVLARQIYYAARPDILRMTGAETLDSQYFTQNILPDYLEGSGKGRKWDIGFDARGHFEEPHTRENIPLGTLDVRDYLKKIETGQGDDEDMSLPNARDFPTCGPLNRYSTILFIEKEGFLPLFKQVKLAERYDLAIMSTKGMSVTASRNLIDEIAAKHAVRVLVLHDFDKAGFSILRTLRENTRRYKFKNEVEVIDLGLRLQDVQEYDLDSEDVYYKGNPTGNLRESGATEEEIAFLRKERVELNAFISEDLIEWIEAKLKTHGVEKVIPDHDTLDAAYRRALTIYLLGKQIEDLRDVIDHEVKQATLPSDLLSRVKKRLEESPEMSWDEAVYLEVDPDADLGEDEEEEEEEANP